MLITHKSNTFIVEDGYNTSYIDSLFVAMFYKPSYMQNILLNNTQNLKFVHLQNLIQNYFLQNTRCGYTIGFDTINEIRNYLFFCGWKKDENMCDNFGVDELYDFIMDGFGKNKLLNLKQNNIQNTFLHKNYIILSVQKNTTIKELIEEMPEKNYCFIDTPTFVPVFLDKTTNGKPNDFLVDVQEGIQFKNSDTEQSKILWTIHSIICYSKTERKYYSIVSYNKSWYLFKNDKLPSLIKINIKDDDLAHKIKKESVFLFYVLDK